MSQAEILTAVTAAINTLRREHAQLLIAIDGRCASGKTTLAATLSEIYGCPVVHMDHFFLRTSQRTKARLRTPGENIDHERFLQEVLLPLREKGTCTYRPFDCATRELAEPITVQMQDIGIIEGSYACHTALREYYDLRLFLSVDPQKQLARIAARNGEDGVAAFKDTWIPLEEAYFSAFDVAAHCDFCFDTSF